MTRSKRTTWAIVPVKRLSQAKRRLAPVLPPEARRRLVLVMLEDVLGTLAGIADVDTVVVVTSDAMVAETAERSGATVLRETRAAGLNAAVSLGLAYAQERGAGAALVLPADVPLATPDELRRIVMDAGDDGRPRALLVPSHDGEGTNALLLSPPRSLEPSFGPGSFLRHLSQAVARKLDVQVLQPSGLAYDIDRPGDLRRLVASTRGSGRYAFLDAHLSRAEVDPSRPPRGTEI